MSRGVIVNNEGALESVLNITTIRALDGDTAYIGEVWISNLSDDDIDAIKTAIEAYSPGGGGGDRYAEGVADGKAAIATSQKLDIANYQVKLRNYDQDIADANIDTNKGQLDVISESYQFIKTPDEITQIQNTAYNNGANEARHLIAMDHQPIAEEYKSILSNVPEIQEQDPTDLIGQRNIFSLSADYLGQSGEEWHSSNPLCFTAEQANSTVKSANNRLTGIEISYDGTNWVPYSERTTITLTNIGDKVYFRSRLITYAASNSCFTMSGKIAASGNPESLIEGNYGDLYFNCYRAMFNNCTSLTTAPELPATNLQTGCYYSMFSGCSSLTSVPELPATTLTNNCYYSMFSGCSSLTSTPELPATTLTGSCYYEMFKGCTRLSTIPELPATTLADSCYYGMFSGCSKITTAPELPATTLTSSCYRAMFQNCSNLTTAPELPANKLVSGCYYYMFTGCSSLNYVKVGATTWSTSYAQNWLSSVSSTGTFYKKTGVSIASGNSGIPSTWTVVEYD